MDGTNFKKEFEENPIRAIVDSILVNSIKSDKKRGDSKDQVSLVVSFLLSFCMYFLPKKNTEYPSSIATTGNDTVSYICFVFVLTITIPSPTFAYRTN